MAGIFYNKTATIWNKRVVDQLYGDEVWKPTVLRDVWYQISGGNNVQKSGNSSADTVRLHISDRLSTAKNKEGGKCKYIEPYEWSKCELDELEHYYTLDDENTVFTCGDSSGLVPDTSMPFFEYLKLHYSNTYKVSNIDRFDSLLPHYEVFGK